MNPPAQKLPPQIKYIIGNEGCERFSFYGMRNILTMYLVQGFLLQESDAQAVFHTFAGAVYLFPLLGGYIADRYFGKYATIFWLSLVYCAGHACLAVFDDVPTGFYVGLGLIALGSGGIKPCVSAFVGDQFTASQKSMAKAVFAAFYWIINFGSFFASLLMPLVLKHHGPAWAFGIPGALMLVATVIFWAGRGLYVNVSPQGSNPHSFLRVLRDAWRGQPLPGRPWLDRALERHPLEAVEAARAVLRVLKIFIPIPIFWALFDQKASTWVLQAKQMDLKVWEWTLEPSQLQAVNPILVMALIPLLNGLVYPALERRGRPLSPLSRMFWGMILAGVSFVAAGGIQLVLARGTQLSVLWQLGPYALLTLGEVLVSVTGLEFAYTQAPREMKGTIMSFWSLTVTLGNYLVVVVAKLAPAPPGGGPGAAGVTGLTPDLGAAAWQLFFFAGLIFAAGGLLRLLSRRHKIVDYFQG